MDGRLQANPKNVGKRLGVDDSGDKWYYKVGKVYFYLTIVLCKIKGNRIDRPLSKYRHRSCLQITAKMRDDFYKAQNYR